MSGAHLGGLVIIAWNAHGTPRDAARQARGLMRATNEGLSEAVEVRDRRRVQLTLADTTGMRQAQWRIQPAGHLAIQTTLGQMPFGAGGAPDGPTFSKLKLTCHD